MRSWVKRAPNVAPFIIMTQLEGRPLPPVELEQRIEPTLVGLRYPAGAVDPETVPAISPLLAEFG